MISLSTVLRRVSDRGPIARSIVMSCPLTDVSKPVTWSTSRYSEPTAIMIFRP